MKAKIGNIEIEGTPKEIKEFIINDSQKETKLEVTDSKLGNDSLISAKFRSVTNSSPSDIQTNCPLGETKPDFHSQIKKGILKDYPICVCGHPLNLHNRRHCTQYISKDRKCPCENFVFEKEDVK